MTEKLGQIAVVTKLANHGSDQTCESSPQSGEMFIATRLPLIISAKSEVLSISLFAEEVGRACSFYKHSVPTARFCADSLERLFFEAKPTLVGFLIRPRKCPAEVGLYGGQLKLGHYQITPR